MSEEDCLYSGPVNTPFFPFTSKYHRIRSEFSKKGILGYKSDILLISNYDMPTFLSPKVKAMKGIVQWPDSKQSFSWNQVLASQNLSKWHFSLLKIAKNRKFNKNWNFHPSNWRRIVDFIFWKWLSRFRALY